MAKEFTIAIFALYFFVLTLSVDFIDDPSLTQVNSNDLTNVKPADQLQIDQDVGANDFVGAAKSFFTTFVKMLFFDINIQDVSRLATNIFLFVFVYLVALTMGISIYIAILHGG